MIERLFFKFGSGENLPPLYVNVAPITVFVGPNNSGKSRILIEIENYCRHTHGQPTDLIAENVEFTPHSKQEIEDELAKIEQTPNPGEIVNPGCIMIGKVNPQNNQAFRAQVDKVGIINEAQNPPNTYQGYYSTFLNMYTVRLDGTNRLNLLNEQAGGISRRHQ